MSRAQREREQYNQGVRREFYEKILSHCRAYSLEEKRVRLASVLAYGENRQVLELGSSCWVGWLEKMGIYPARSDAINISERSWK